MDPTADEPPGAVTVEVETTTPDDVWAEAGVLALDGEPEGEPDEEGPAEDEDGGLVLLGGRDTGVEVGVLEGEAEIVGTNGI